MFDLENHEENRWKNRKSLLEMRLSHWNWRIHMKSQDRYFGLRSVFWMWINLPRSTGGTLLALWCHPIHYPAFEMKFEVKNNQTNETEFYVKRSKPSQFKYQHSQWDEVMFVPCKALLSRYQEYRIYSINRPGRLLNFWTLRVGAYSRWAFIRGWALIKFFCL